MDKERPLSHSQLQTYTSCARKYKYQYIDEIKRDDDSIALAFGKALHTGIEKFHLSYFSNELTLEEMFNSFELAYKEETKNLEIEQEEWTNNFEMGLDACAVYYSKFHGRGRPLIALGEDGSEMPCVEMKFEIPIEYQGNFIKDIRGVIDLIVITDDGICVVDHKTSKTDYNDFQINTSDQLALYAHVFRKMLREGRFPQLIKNGKPIQETEDLVVYNVFKKMPKNTKRKTNGVEMSHYSKKVTEGDIQGMLRSYDMMKRGVNAGYFAPNFTPFCKACKFQDICEKDKG